MNEERKIWEIKEKGNWKESGKENRKKVEKRNNVKKWEDKKMGKMVKKEREENEK